MSSSADYVPAPAVIENATIDALIDKAYTASDALPWLPGKNPGSSRKVLIDDPRLGLRVTISKLEPDTHIGSHLHETEYEQMFVLKGDIDDGIRTLKAGDYVARVPGVPHVAHTKNGVEVLVIFIDPRGWQAAAA